MGETTVSIGQGRYQLIRAVGRGGMATVYQATDTALGRDVAVKVMDRTATGEDFRKRFRREARAVATLNHRNVITIHDIGEEPVRGGEATPYMVMEFVHGRPLSDLVSNGPTAVREALRITADVLDGLAASHDAGLVHRDIKPANVMMTGDSAVKVLDFGIARPVAADTSAVTRTGTVVGTAHYMSPEQARGQELDHRSDLYSTGILLFELLSGRRPFDEGVEAVLMYHHLHTQPPLLSDVGTVVPEKVQNLLSSALEKDPENRPASARQMRSLVLAAAEEASPIRPPVVTQQPHMPALPTYAPTVPPVPPVSPSVGAAAAGGWTLRIGLVAALVGYVAALVALTRFSAFLFGTTTASDAYWLCYGLMYAPVLFGLLVGVRQFRAAVHTAHRRLAMTCIAVNGLWGFYHLGTWLFEFPFLWLP